MKLKKNLWSDSEKGWVLAAGSHEPALCFKKKGHRKGKHQGEENQYVTGR